MAGLGLSWAIVVPVKRLESAKSRLRVAAALRADLALAMASDTVSAALACAGVRLVVVVTDDDRAGSLLAGLGARVVPDLPDAGLNPALRHGAQIADDRTQTAVAALSSDLPALRSDELAAVLSAAARFALALVADAAGDGTTMLTAGSVDLFRPAFGMGSHQAHVAGGAHDLTGIAGPSLRRDVDTVDDLRAAADLGCGPATRAVLAAHPSLLERTALG